MARVFCEYQGVLFIDSLIQKRIISAVYYSKVGILFVDLLIENRTINAAYHSKLLKDRIKPAFRSKRRGRSVKSVCLLHGNARPHTAAVTTETTPRL